MSSGSDTSLRREGPPLWLVLVFLGCYTALLLWRMGAVAGAADTSGYMNGARLLLSGQLHCPERILGSETPGSLPSHAYVPLGMSPERDNWDHMVPTYPMGLPVLLAGATLLVGAAKAPVLVLCLFSLLLPVVLYQLSCDAGLGWRQALFLAAAISLSPLVITMSLMAMSDVPCATLSLAALLGAWRSRSGQRLLPALGAGFCVGLAVLIRPTTVLIGLPLLVLSGLRWRVLLGLALGSLPGLLAMLGFNRDLYHSPFVSGYGSVFEIFGRENLAPSLLQYAQWGLVCFTPLALLVLVFPFLSVWRRSALHWALFCWVVLLAAFYAFYPFTWQAWWYLRFLLPAGPVAALLGFLVLGRLRDWDLERWGRRACLLAVLGLGLWSLGWGWYLRAARSGLGERSYVEACEWAKREIPDNGVIVCGQCSGAVFYYCPQLLVRRDAMRDGAFARLCAAAAREGRPVYAMMFMEEAECLDTPGLKGDWDRVGDVRHISFWRLRQH